MKTACLFIFTYFCTLGSVQELKGQSFSNNVLINETIFKAIDSLVKKNNLSEIDTLFFQDPSLNVLFISSENSCAGTISHNRRDTLIEKIYLRFTTASPYSNVKYLKKKSRFVLTFRIANIEQQSIRIVYAIQEISYRKPFLKPGYFLSKNIGSPVYFAFTSETNLLEVFKLNK